MCNSLAERLSRCQCRSTARMPKLPSTCQAPFNPSKTLSPRTTASLDMWNTASSEGRILPPKKTHFGLCNWSGDFSFITGPFEGNVLQEDRRYRKLTGRKLSLVILNKHGASIVEFHVSEGLPIPSVS